MILTIEQIDHSTTQFIDIFHMVVKQEQSFSCSIAIYIFTFKMIVLSLPQFHILQLIRQYTTKRPIMRE